VGGKRIFLIGLACGAVALVALFGTLGYDAVWRLWNIPTMTPAFADLRVITGCSESWALGFDPLLHNPGDPWGRALNWPRIWHVVCAAGLDQSSTVVLGAALAALLFAGVFLFLPSAIHEATGALLLVVFFSPAIMLGIERGNIDLLMFFLVSLAIHLLDRDSAVARRFATGAMVLAFVLRLYPAVGLPVLISDRQRLLRVGGVLSILVAGYLAVTFTDIQLIYLATEKSTFLSYGINVVPTFVTKNYGAGAGSAAKLIGWAAVVACFAVAMHGLSRPPPGDLADDQKSRDGFRVGAAIYLGTFLAVGSSWDYRLVFLLLTIPQLFALARSRHRLAAILARLLLVNIVVSTWYLLFCRILDYSAFGFFLDELNNWSLFFGMAYLFAWLAPPWMKELSGGLLRRTA
jgi:hypothetical protein